MHQVSAVSSEKLKASAYWQKTRMGNFLRQQHLFVLLFTRNNIQSLYLLTKSLICMQKVQPWHHNSVH